MTAAMKSNGQADEKITALYCRLSVCLLYTSCGCYGQKDLFESMERGMRAKMEIIRLYPHMANFTIKAFYEKDADISAAVQESYHKYFNLKADKTRVNMDPVSYTHLDVYKRQTQRQV